MNANTDDVRVFDLYSILAVTHGLPSTPQQYRDIVGFLIGLPMGGAGMTALVYGPACRAWLFEQHPQLRTVPARPDFAEDDTAGMDAWAAEQAKRLGADRLPVQRPPAATPGDPFTDFINKTPDPWKVYLVDPDAPDVDPNAGWSE